MDSKKQQQQSPDTFLVPNESKKGREEFSCIAEDENKRVQQVVETENERIMNEMRTNGTIKMCPLCLDEIPPIKAHKEHKAVSDMVMMCCGVVHCDNCKEKSLDFLFRDDNNAKCFNCREPMRDATEWVKTIKPNDQRHWLLQSLASEHMHGTNGLRKNIKKAVKLYKRAADLGNTDAQDELAVCYFFGYGDSGYGGSIITRCLEKAKYYAEKAAYQGAINSQNILAHLLRESEDCNRDEKAFQLLTLAAFQGCLQSGRLLGYRYEERFRRMTTAGAPVGNKEWRKNLLLSLYWYGKSAEVEKKNSKECKSLPNMVVYLDLAMRELWHRRDDGYHASLPGYSHIPFCTWALAKGVKQTTVISTSDLGRWKNRCANCKHVSEKNDQFKSCARCKAFHYCSKKCQVEHWKAGHKVDCKGHWIEEFFPDLRKSQP